MSSKIQLIEDACQYLVDEYNKSHGMDLQLDIPSWEFNDDDIGTLVNRVKVSVLYYDGDICFYVDSNGTDYYLREYIILPIEEPNLPDGGIRDLYRGIRDVVYTYMK